MRVLILGPNHEGGSLPPYLDALATGLRNAGVAADRQGSTAIPYDQGSQRFWSIDRIIGEARALADRIDPTAYDIVALNSGNLEIDCLAATFWPERLRPPMVYHVHTLEPTLFRDHVPDTHWNSVVQHQIHHADGFIYFGRYGLDRLAPTISGRRMRTVAWLPTTIPAGTPPQPSPPLGRALQVPHGLPVISLYGYAAPWKDAALLASALPLMHRPARIVLAGEFWDAPLAGSVTGSPAGTPRRAGVTEFVTVPAYLDAADRAALIRASAAGVFPYRPHQSFQGSGAIADYLAHLVPVVATDVANMDELIGDAGHVVPADNPAALAAALDTTIAGNTGSVGYAGQRAQLFSADAHAARCVRFYQQVIDNRTGAPA